MPPQQIGTGYAVGELQFQILTGQANALPAALSPAAFFQLQMNSADNQVYATVNGGAWVPFLNSSGGVLTTLDLAYDGAGAAGSGRTIVADAGAVTITDSAADNNNVLELNKTPSGAQSGAALKITLSAAATGAGITFGTGAAATAVELLGATDKNLIISAGAGAGNRSVRITTDVANSGTIILATTGGSTIMAADGSLGMWDGQTITTGTVTGTTIGSGATQKVGLWGKKAVRPAAYTVSGLNALRVLVGDGTDTLATVGRVLGSLVTDLQTFMLA